MKYEQVLYELTNPELLQLSSDGSIHRRQLRYLARKFMNPLYIRIQNLSGQK